VRDQRYPSRNLQIRRGPLAEDLLETREAGPPERAPRPPKAKTPPPAQAGPAPEAEIIALLRGRGALRRAILLHAILSPPLALRDEAE
jgi:hypothetical protein